MSRRSCAFAPGTIMRMPRRRAARLRALWRAVLGAAVLLAVVAAAAAVGGFLRGGGWL